MLKHLLSEARPEARWTDHPKNNQTRVSLITHKTSHNHRLKRIAMLPLSRNVGLCQGDVKDCKA
jgi:hypothetical protein